MGVVETIGVVAIAFVAIKLIDSFSSWGKPYVDPDEQKKRDDDAKELAYLRKHQQEMNKIEDDGRVIDVLNAVKSVAAGVNPVVAASNRLRAGLRAQGISETKIEEVVGSLAEIQLLNLELGVEQIQKTDPSLAEKIRATLVGLKDNGSDAESPTHPLAGPRP